MQTDINKDKSLQKLKHDINGSTEVIEMVLKTIDENGFDEQSRELLKLVIERVGVLRGDQDRLCRLVGDTEDINAL